MPCLWDRTAQVLLQKAVCTAFQAQACVLCPGADAALGAALLHLHDSASGPLGVAEAAGAEGSGASREVLQGTLTPFVQRGYLLKCSPLWREICPNETSPAHSGFSSSSPPPPLGAHATGAPVPAAHLAESAPVGDGAPSSPSTAPAAANPAASAGKPALEDAPCSPERPGHRPLAGSAARSEDGSPSGVGDSPGGGGTPAGDGAVFPTAQLRKRRGKGRK